MSDPAHTITLPRAMLAPCNPCSRSAHDRSLYACEECEHGKALAAYITRELDNSARTTDREDDSR